MKPLTQATEAIRTSLKEDVPPSAVEDAAIGSTDGWSPETSRKEAKSNKFFILISLIIAAVMIMVVVTALLWHNNLQIHARADYDSETAQAWKEHQLILIDTRRLLEGQSDLESGKELLESHVAFFKGMQQLIQQPGIPVQLTLPSEYQNELRELQKLLDEWAGLHEKPWASLQPSETKDSASDILVAYRHWQDSRTATWKQLTAFISLNGFPPPADDLVQSLKVKAKGMLSHVEPMRGSVANWKQVFQLQGHPNSPVDSEVQHWLKLWTELDGPDASAFAAALTAAADNSLPEWLRAKSAALKQRQDQEKAGQMAENKNQEEGKHAKETQKPRAAIEDADSMTATNAIYICLLQSSEDPADKITGLPVTADMQLYVGTAWDAHPRPDAKTEPKYSELKKWPSVSLDGSEEFKFGPTLFAKLTDMIVFSLGGKLTAFPEGLRQSPDGVRIVARSKDGTKVLFDLRIFKPAASQPTLLPFVLKAALIESPEWGESPELGALLNRFPSINTTSQFKLRPPLNLEEPWDVKLENGKWILSSQKSALVQNTQAIMLLTNQIQTLSDGIKNLENLKAILNRGQSGTVIKLKQYEDGIAAKESELAEAKEKLASLKLSKELPKPTSPSGEYTLHASPKAGTEIDICKVQIVLPAKSPATPTTNP